MELLMCKLPTFCQFFLRRETKKLIDNMTLAVIWSSVISTCPMATPRHSTFLSWNLMVDLTSFNLLLRSSACEMGVGNLPAKIGSGSKISTGLVGTRCQYAGLTLG